jgi:hypothetical protein
MSKRFEEASDTKADGVEEENFIKSQSPESRSNKKIDAFGKKS